MKRLTFLPLILVLFLLNACDENKKGILPNPNKVYSDQCFVWLKEMPDFFRERHYLDNGLAWDRHSYQGIYVSDNPESMFYSRHYVGHTVVLFRPDEPGGEMRRGNIIYQYSLSQGNDSDLHQIWLQGEFRPPEDCKQWVVGATGKHRGVRAEGIWHWHWPENRNWEQPENPPGYDYPNAEEFNYAFPPEGDGQADMVGKRYWIDDAPFGVDNQGLSLGLPATEKPARTKHLEEKGYILVKKLPDLQQKQLIPPGNRKGPTEKISGFDHYNFEGIYIPDDPGSPFYSIQLSGKSMAIYEPSQGEDMTSSNMHCQYLMIQCGRHDGDQVWWWGEAFPPQRSQLTLKVATGRFKGLSAVGSWYTEWPADREIPEIPEEYDYAIACDFIYEIPVNE